MTDPTVRMSDINTSINSDILPPLHCSTFNLTPDEIYKVKSEDIKTHVSADSTADTQTFKGESKITLPKLKITNNNDILTDISVKSVATDSPSPNTPRQKKPIMGKTALLSRANLEKNDVQIIQEIVSGKYSPVTQALQNRMHRRRRIRQDQSEDEYSDTVFSTPPNGSPLSTSTIDTTNSGDIDRNGFYFPSSGDVKDLRFLRSTDDVNVDTTIEELEASSLNSSAVSHEKSMSYTEYDPKVFLNNAIGDLKGLSGESKIVEKTSEKNEVHTKPEDYSVRTTDVSSLLSRTNGLYSSLKNSIKKKTLKLQATCQQDKKVMKRQSVISENSFLESLMRELSIQNEIMFQISKALDYCRTMKGFETTVEFLEAERILLVASCRKAALTKEIENVEDDTFENKNDFKSYGQVHLSNFNFFPKRMDEPENNSLKELIEQYVMVLTCGSTVLASEVLLSDKDGHVRIDKSFEFKNLAPDFEIAVLIYAMIVPSKAHQNQDHGNCPLPKRLFHSKISRKYKVASETFYIKPTSFILWGRCEIRGSDLSKVNPENTNVTLKMYNIPLSSSLSGMFSVDVQSSVTLNNRISGFLTIGQENEHGCTLWNRRWCVLEGTVLKYWNYPSEEVASAMGSFDLSNCLERQISGVDRSLCARPRTLSVTVKFKEGAKNYLLSADNLSDMKEWEKEINYVLRSLNLWSCTSSKIP